MHPDEDSHNHYDLVVVGAGPAGATAGYLLAQKGLHVLLLDKEQFPRDKLCGGLLSPKTFQLLKTLFNVQLRDLTEAGIVLSRADAYGLRIGEYPEVYGRLPEPFWFTDRRAFDHFLLRRAERAGARVRLGVAVSSVDPDRNLVRLETGEEISFDTLVAADGAASPIRKQLLDNGQLDCDPAVLNRGMASGAEVFFPGTIVPGGQDVPLLSLGPAGWGYGWVFPHGADKAIGVLERKHSASRNVRGELKSYLHSLLLPEPTRFRGHPVPYGNTIARPYFHTIFLLGDAACLTDPLTGEGIFAAMKSAQLLSLSWQPGARRPDAREFTRRLASTLVRENRWATRWARVFYLRPSWLRNWLAHFVLVPVTLNYLIQVINGERSYRPFTPGICAQRDSEPANYTTRAWRAILISVGFILSPLTWWNDAFVNIPIAYAMAWLLSRYVPAAFTSVFIISYWLTNLFGFVLLHLGLSGPDRTRQKVPGHPWLRLLTISLIYSLLIVLLSWLGWIPMPQESAILRGG